MPWPETSQTSRFKCSSLNGVTNPKSPPILCAGGRKCRHANLPVDGFWGHALLYSCRQYKVCSILFLMRFEPRVCDA